MLSDRSKKKNDWVDILYVVSVVLSFGLLFFAHEAETPDGVTIELGVGKLFYIPCATALILSAFKWHRTDRVDRLIILLLFFSIVSSLISPPNTGGFLSWSLTRFSLGILCFWNLRNVSSQMFIRVLSIVSPVIIFAHYILSAPLSYGLYRYAGFYGDPNYLAMGLNFIIAINYLNWKTCKHLIIRLINVATIIGTIPLVLVGVSRGGILGLIVILFIIAIDLFAKSKKRFVLLVIVSIILGGSVISLLSPQIENIKSRFESESVSDYNSAYSRVLEIQSVFNVLSSHPQLIPFGVGLGNNMRAKQLYPDDYIDRFEVHNTFIKLLFEQGLFAFFVFLFLMIKQLFILCRKREKIYLGLYLSSLMTTMTLGCITFMPFWIVFFFLWNRDLC